MRGGGVKNKGVGFSKVPIKCGCEISRGRLMVRKDTEKMKKKVFLNESGKQE